MRICVIGCGVVGSIFAANLAGLEDVEVWVCDVAEDHVRAINEHGLRLTGAGDVVGHVRATTNPQDIPEPDFGILATKSMHTESAIRACGRLFNDESAVCSVQNGVGNEEILAQHVRYVIRGTTFPAGRMVRPGVVAWDVKGDTWIGPFEPTGTPMERVRRLADVLTRGGLNTIALEDARGAQWTKLIFNAATNPLGALTGLTHGRLCELEATRRLITSLVDEGKAVAAALGIALDQDPEALIDHAARVAYDHKASMLQDVEAHRQTEIDFLNGGITRFGDEVGLPTPINQAITALVKGLEHSWSRQSVHA